MNDTIISLLIGVGIGIGLSLLYLAYRIKMVMNSLDAYIDEAIEKVTDNIVKMSVEKDNGIYYSYRTEDRQFLCQGATLDELLDAFKLKHPNQIAVISRDTDQAIIDEFKATLK